MMNEDADAQHDPSTLRSNRWFGPDDLRSFGHRSRLKGMGIDDTDYQNRPVVALLNTWSDLNTCHSHFRDRAAEIKRGVYQAGGFPVEIPVMSLGEMMMKPTTMLYRNMLAMEVEEVLRCHPVDSAVLMGGCDKTVPAMLMGAISADIPSVFFPAGPMLKAYWKDETLGSGSDAWKYWNERCAGNFCDADWKGVENCIARSAGTCMTMGTASTMACIAEALGFALPKSSSIPSVVAEHSRLAVACGRLAVDLAWKNRTPKSLLSRGSFENAIVTWLAIGGSTNAIVHLIALAGRSGIPLSINDFDAWSGKVPMLANIRPSGAYLMEEFDLAGGLPALLAQLQDLLDTDARCIEGGRMCDRLENAEIINTDVVRVRDNPVLQSGGLCVLRGNLAPSGCIIKSSAATPSLMQHRGPAVVFKDYPDLKARINSPELNVTADSVLVLKNAGPQGAPGFPEWGMLPIPQKLLKQGIRDMVRISDARMSGTSYGTCVLHVSPESYAGGPLAIVQDGDMIELDVPQRKLHLDLPQAEIDRRLATLPAPVKRFVRGYTKLFTEHVSQADEGCDFDFLVGSESREPDIF
jgi:dihydroxy-acid dehydratase